LCSEGLIVKQRITAVDAASFSKMWAWNARAMAALFFPSGPLGLQRWFAKTLVKEQSDWSAAQVMDLEWDLTPMLPRIATPTLILQRESVKLADPRQSTTAARLMPNARLLMMDGDADHAIHDYEQYLDTLLSFLEEHAPAKSERRATGGAPTLTERETEVLSLLAGGRTGREIAEALGISLSTAQRHIANIYGKIGARGRVDAAAYALARGLVTPRE
jgi:DNA-binding CsgD family transcriptional regulator